LKQVAFNPESIDEKIKKKRTLINMENASNIILDGVHFANSDIGFRAQNVENLILNNISATNTLLPVTIKNSKRVFLDKLNFQR
jgi:hypothetical protein